MTRSRNPGKGYVGTQRGEFVKGRDATHTIEAVNIVRESDKAVLVEISADVEIWIPLSQIKSIHRDTKHKGNDSVVMTEWIAKQKGLLE